MASAADVGMIKELPGPQQRTHAGKGGDDRQGAAADQKKHKLVSEGGRVPDTINETDVPGLTMKGVALDAAKVNAAFGLK